ncbi:MAG: hypothetical protein JSV96_07690, partial [Candidatus Aminicenantes bacterium]
ESGPLLASLGAPLLFAVAVAANEDIKKAFFGSCPTVYSSDKKNYFLEAECFSYSIAEMFESDDLDRLDNLKISTRECILKVANEALETHYINEMKLLTVDHPYGYESFPTSKRKILLLGKKAKILEATDSMGRNIIDLISSRDDHCYRSDTCILHELSKKIIEDWIEIKVKIPPEAKKINVAFRMRNTLFNTVLLYDVLLKSNGAEAIDWIGKKTGDLFYAWEFSTWYKKYFGLRIQLWDGKKFKDVGRISDAGPIAWKQIGIDFQFLKMR